MNKPWSKRTVRHLENTWKKKEEQIRKARENDRFPGLYICDANGRVMIADCRRKLKALKRISNRQVRRAEDVGQYGAYRKVYDYKRNLS